MTKKGLIGALLMACLLFSCDGDRVYEQFEMIPNQSWSVSDTIRFQLGPIAERGSKDLIAVRFTDEYPFRNAYVKLIQRDSSEAILEEKLVNVTLFDPKSGRPLGKGFGNTHTHYDTLDFRLREETSTVELLQYMRVNELLGIESVGIKILK
ncbi:gliding motility lipoprotein GldH [Algoriphagus namhaensis]